MPVVDPVVIGCFKYVKYMLVDPLIAVVSGTIYIEAVYADDPPVPLNFAFVKVLFVKVCG